MDLNKELNQAIENNDLDKVKRLYKKGADLSGKYNHRDHVWLVCVSGHADILKYFLSKDIEVSSNCLFKAIENKKDDVIKILIKDDKTHLKTMSYQVEPLDQATYFESAYAVNLLMEEVRSEKSKYVVKDSKLNEYFVTSCLAGNIDIVKTFIKHGIAPDVDGDSGIKAAVYSNHMKVVDYLHKQGATGGGDINLAYIAVKSGSPDTLRYLIKRGFKLDAKLLLSHKDNFRGEEVVDLLINNLNNIDDIKYNSAFYKVSKEKFKLVEDKCSTPLNINKSLEVSIKSGNLVLANLFLDRGAKINKNDDDLLHSAILNFDTEMVKLLINQGIETIITNIEDDYSKDPRRLDIENILKEEIKRIEKRSDCINIPDTKFKDNSFDSLRKNDGFLKAAKSDNFKIALKSAFNKSSKKSIITLKDLLLEDENGNSVLDILGAHNKLSDLIIPEMADRYSDILDIYNNHIKDKYKDQLDIKSIRYKLNSYKAKKKINKLKRFSS